MTMEINERIIKGLPIGYALHEFVFDNKGNPCDYIYVDINNKFEEYMGVNREDIIGKRVTDILPDIREDKFDWIETYAKVAFEKVELNFTNYSLPLNKWFKVLAYSPEEGYFVTIVEDVTDEVSIKNQYLEAKKVIEGQNAIIRTFHNDFLDINDFFEYVLNKALEIFESKYGYIFIYDEDKGEFTLQTFTHGVMKDCTMNDKPIKYILEDTGLWGEVVRQRKAIVINDYNKDNPAKKGYPDGHVKIDRLLAIPVFYNKKIVATVGLANKETNYTDIDVNQLTILIHSAWIINEAKLQARVNKEERDRFDKIINQLPIIFSEVDTNGRIRYINEGFKDHFTERDKEYENKCILNLLPENERKPIKREYLSLSPDKPISDYIQHVEGKDKWIQWKQIANFDDNNQLSSYYSLGMDITDRKQLEVKKLQELEQIKGTLESNRAVIMFLEVEDGNIIYANKAASSFYGYTNDELLNMNISDINMLDNDKLKDIRSSLKVKENNFYVVPHKLKNGEIRMVDGYGSLVDYENRKVIFLIIFDVTEKENAMKEIKTLAYNDHLTGLYNRRYLEEAFAKMNKAENFPIALILGDINGLKMVNDNYGMAIGDQLIIESVKLMRGIIPKECIMARIGGDEFMFIIPKADEIMINQLTDVLEKGLEKTVHIGDNKEAEVFLSISFGYSIQNKYEKNMEFLIRESEFHLKKKKSYNERSTHSQMIVGIMSTLFQKSEREQKHSVRVGNFCEEIAKALDFDYEKTLKLKVAGNFHDIGKIGIDESILNKPGKLNDEEWETMKLHPLKSANILDNIREYKDIAEIVAYHHERIDGKGYPSGLKDKEIPLESRIIAVADAYDAMTEQRAYREPMTKKEAIEELYRCSGTQFDYDIVDAFVKNVLLKN